LVKQSAPMRWPFWVVAALIGCASGLALAAEDSLNKDHPRVKAFRKDAQYDRLFRDGSAFLALSPEKQDAMRKLHGDLEKLPPAERERLTRILSRYADWLERLPAEERKAVVGAADKGVRLKRIRQIRDKEWIGRQAAVVRRQWENLPQTAQPPAVLAATVIGLLASNPRQVRPLAAASALLAEGTDLRTELVRRAKREEAARTREWVIAQRHWNELTEPGKRQGLPARASDFGKEVETFVKEYLRPWLSVEEKELLDNAEGHWPQYPMTLIDLAERHPMALPQQRGPNAYGDLPADVRARVSKVFLKEQQEGKKGKKEDNWFHNPKTGMKGVEQRLESAKLRGAPASLKFAAAVAAFAEAKNLRMPYELWASKPSEMSPPMQVFLDEKGPFKEHLLAAERDQLKAAEGKWPEYPLLVRDLARQTGFTPPWQTLPDIGGKREVWEKYQVKGGASGEE
jgi:hypothetical protein